MAVSLTVFLPSYLFVAPTFTSGMISGWMRSTPVPEYRNAPSTTPTPSLPMPISTATTSMCEIPSSPPSSSAVWSGWWCCQSWQIDLEGKPSLFPPSPSRLSARCVSAELFSFDFRREFHEFAPDVHRFDTDGIRGVFSDHGRYSYLSEINNDLWRQKSLILTYSFW